MHGHGARSYAEPTMDTTAPSSGGNEVAEMACGHMRITDEVIAESRAFIEEVEAR